MAGHLKKLRPFGEALATGEFFETRVWDNGLAHVGEETGNFITRTVPNVAGTTARQTETFFTGAIPGAAETVSNGVVDAAQTVGRETKNFFTKTLKFRCDMAAPSVLAL